MSSPFKTIYQEIMRSVLVVKKSKTKQYTSPYAPSKHHRLCYQDLHCLRTNYWRSWMQNFSSKHDNSLKNVHFYFFVLFCFVIYCPQVSSNILVGKEDIYSFLRGSSDESLTKMKMKFLRLLFHVRSLLSAFASWGLL